MPDLINKQVAAHLVGLTHMGVMHWAKRCYVSAIPFETKAGISYLVRRNEILALKEFKDRSATWAGDLKAIANEQGLAFPAEKGAIAYLEGETCGKTSAAVTRETKRRT